MMILRAAFVALSLLVPAGKALADDATQEAQAAAQALQSAMERLEAAAGARDRVAALTEVITAHERGLAALRVALRDAALREAAIRRRFESRHEEVSRLVGVLSAMERSAGPLLLLHPSGPLGTARSGMMLAEVTPSLQAEAEALRADLEELAALRSTQEQAAETLGDGLRALQRARTELSKAISDRRDLPRRVIDDPAALRALMASADTLDALSRGLMEGAADAESEGGATASRDFADARGTLPLPVRGTLLRRPGETDPAGVRRPGISIATAPRALVTTPAAATIRYVGPLLDHSNVVVLDPGGGFLLVLVGLDSVYGQVGDILPEGEAIGLMGGEDPDRGEFIARARATGGENRSETLYIEIRHDTEPVNPMPWFTQTRDRTTP